MKGRRSKSSARVAKRKSRRPAPSPRKKPPGKKASEASLEVARLRKTRYRLERRLTALVQEIGLLRQYEVRARMLEAELQKRDQELVALRRQYEERTASGGA